MKPGDLVKYNKPASFIWQPPFDISNGAIGLIVKEISDDEVDESTTLGDISIMIDGRIRIVPKFFLELVNETR